MDEVFPGMDVGQKTDQRVMSEEPSTYDLLRLCARVEPSPEERATIQGRVEKGIDWEAFWRLAFFHGLHLLVYNTLKTTCPNALPPETSADLEGIERNAHVRNRFFLRELQRILELFEAEGVPALTFKGPVLTQTAYGSLRLRQSGDLDLLIPPSSLSRVGECLRSNGYEAARRPSKWLGKWLARNLSRQVSFVRGAPVYALDIHTRIMPPLYAFNPAFEELWERGAQTSVDGFELRLMAPEDRLLVVCHHGVKNQWSQLSFVCDVAESVRSYRGVEWEAVLEHARALKSERILCSSVYLAHRALDSPLPQPIERAAERMEGLDDILNRILWRYHDPFERGKMGYGERVRFHTAMQDNVRAKMRYVTFSAFRRLMDGATHPAR